MYTTLHCSTLHNTFIQVIFDLFLGLYESANVRTLQIRYGIITSYCVRLIQRQCMS
jgi:hypothetical protein